MSRTQPAGGSVAADGTSRSTGGDHGRPTISDVVALANRLEHLTSDGLRRARPVGLVRLPSEIDRFDRQWWCDPAYLDTSRPPPTPRQTPRVR
jgi:hypothetical protein